MGIFFFIYQNGLSKTQRLKIHISQLWTETSHKYTCHHLLLQFWRSVVHLCCFCFAPDKFDSRSNKQVIFLRIHSRFVSIKHNFNKVRKNLRKKLDNRNRVVNMSSFLDSDQSILDNKLRFVKVSFGSIEPTQSKIPYRHHTSVCIQVTKLNVFISTIHNDWITPSYGPRLEWTWRRFEWNIRWDTARDGSAWERQTI